MESISFPEPIKQKIKEESLKRPDKFAEVLGRFYRIEVGENGEKKRISTLAKWQRAYLYDNSRRIIVKTARQVGKSTMSAIKAIWRAWLFDNQFIIIIAPKFDQAKIIFNKIIELLMQPNNLIANAIMSDVLKINYTGQIWFKNGSKIYVLSAGGDINKIRGYSAHMIIVDEAQSVKDEVFAILEPMLISTRGQMILLGTPLDYSGYFYNAWTSEEFSKHEADPFDRPWLSREEIEKEMEYYRRMYGETRFMREMLGRFARDTGTFFDMNIVDEAMKLVKRKAPELGYDYIMGIDPASSGSDKTGVVILGVREDDDDIIVEMHYFAEYDRIWDEYMYEEIKRLISHWNVKLVVVDTIGLGDPIAERIRTENPLTEVMGYKSVGRRRLQMYFDLRYALAQKKLLLIKDDVLRVQFYNYELVTRQDGTYTVKKGSGHDDVVDALALALQGVKYRFGGIDKKQYMVISERMIKIVNEVFGGLRGESQW